MAQKPNTKNEVRATVIVDKGVIDDLKFIALWDKKEQKEIVNELFTRYITEWKAKNKSVKFPTR